MYLASALLSAAMDFRRLLQSTTAPGRNSAVPVMLLPEQTAPSSPHQNRPRDFYLAIDLSSGGGGDAGSDGTALVDYEAERKAKADDEQE